MFTLGGRVHVRPVLGEITVDKVTVPVNEPVPVTVIVEPAAWEARTVTLVGDAPIVKSAVTGTLTVTVSVTLRVWVEGVDVVRVAVPVITTVQVTVDAAVPPKVTTSVSFWPAVSVTGLVVGVTVRLPHPVPVTVDESVTGPAKPAALTVAAASDGLLPIVKVLVVEEPELKEKVLAVCVTLKSCGLTLNVSVTNFDPLGRVPVARVVTVYVPVAVVHGAAATAGHGGMRPPANVSVTVLVPAGPGVTVVAE